MPFDFAPLGTATVQAVAGLIPTALQTLVGVIATAALPVLYRKWKEIGVRLRGADRTLLDLAIDNAAENAVTAFEARVGTMAGVVADMVAYTRRNVPDAVRRLKADEVLPDMCSAAFARTLTARRAARGAAGESAP